MKLRALRLHNVRRFTARGVAIEGIGDGVNVLAEANEHGKSTCFDALHALFFTAHTSRTKAVQELRPYSGGAIQVEADLEEGGRLYRLGKRYYGSAFAQVTEVESGRVVAQADEAEAWIGARVRGGSAGPAGLLWVQQGIVEMHGRTGKAKDEEQAAREDVLTSVSGEIETLTGGKRMAHVLASCEGALHELVTATGKPKTGGRYANAIEERDALENEVQALSTRVAELRDDLDARRSAQARLAELDDPETAARDAETLRAAEAALQKAEAHAVQLEQAVLTERLARQEHDRAAEALERFDAALERLGALDRRAEQEQAVAAEAEEALKAAREADDTAAADLRRRESMAKQTQEALDTARKAALAHAARERRDRLRKTLEAAEHARAQAEAATAEADALAVPDVRIKALDALEDRIAELKAELRASAVTVELSYDDPGKPRIARDGVPLADGDALTITDPVRLDIEGVGSLAIRPGGGEGTAALTRSLSEAQAQRAALLAELGVENRAAVQARRGQSEERRRIARDHTARLEAIAPDGIEALRRQFAALERDAEEAGDVAEPIELLEQRLAEAQVARDAAQSRREETRITLTECDKALAGATQSLRRTRSEIDAQRASLGEAADPEARKALADAAATAKTALDAARTKADALREAAPDLETLRAQRARAASVVDRTREEAAALRTQIASLDSVIARIAEDGVEERLAETRGRRDRAAERVAALETEIATLQKLRGVLIDARAEAKEHFFEPILREMKPLLDIVFEDAAIDFDEHTLLPKTVEREGLAEEFAVLSGGMREQVTVLTRLAFARLLARGGHPVPVILDDALIYSDDDRIERMFTALHRQAADLQILVFTCRQRAFRTLGDKHLKLTLWTPDA